MRIEIDVTAVAPRGVRTVVADVFAPEREQMTPDALVLCCLPGGGMSRRYFDLDVDATLGKYSMARHLAGAGFVVVTLDHPGVGESDRPDDGYTLTPQCVADVDAFAFDHIIGQLRMGTLDDDLPAMPRLTTIGVGHSAGASITAYQQARHRSHRAVALLGYGGAGLASHLNDREKEFARRPDAVVGAIAELVRERFGEPLPMQRRGSSDFLVGAPMPEAVRAALVACRTPLLALVGLSSMIPGTTAPVLAQIDVPVFVAHGTRDIAGSLPAVAVLFPASNDITLFVLDDSGHNHNVAPTREQLWDRLGRWARTLVSVESGGHGEGRDG
ncbi:MAG TPA: alpha/beta fold hydrolase [Acidimicrobiales bacterium]|nr:alpha/beta fold hydrolase [Acidimicrobiales bacterium]